MVPSSHRPLVGLCAWCVYVRQHCCVARALLRKVRARQLADEQSRARWHAGPGPGAEAAEGGAEVDWLQGASETTLGGPPTQRELGFFTRVANARKADPEGSFAYLPAVNRNHPTVDPAYHTDTTCPGAGWFLAMMVR